MNRIDTIMAEIKRSKISRIKSNMGKMQKQFMELEKPILLDEMNKEELAFMFIQIKRKEMPTVDSLRKELLDGINHIYSNHTLNKGYLNHDCCLGEWLNSIIKLIEHICNREHLLEQLNTFQGGGKDI